MQASSWTGLDHLASGLIERTNRIFHARFHYGSGPFQPLTLLGLLTRWIILQQARSRTFRIATA